MGWRSPVRLALASVLLGVAVAGGSAAPVRSAPDTQPAPGAYQESFTGKPSAPTPWRQHGWDITVHSRDRQTWDQLEPIAAHHGPDCAAAPAVHVVTSYDDAVFSCNDHLMTSIAASGYGVIYLTPGQLLDFSGGEAVLRFDLSTLRTSKRDWVDIWLTPYAEQHQLPLEHWLPDLTGEPPRALHIRMDDGGSGTTFKGYVYRGNVQEELSSLWWVGYESFLQPSAVRRDAFELRVSRTSVKFGMPDYGRWWIDTPMADLGWDRAVVQFGHHSYTPTKDCGNCAPNTWHWDSVSMAPSVPFTILQADRRWATDEAGPTVAFEAPAPPESHLRFVAIGSGISVSFDGGATWRAAQPRPTRARQDKDDVFRSYWTPMPAGATGVTIQGQGWYGGPWAARDLTVWSPIAGGASAAPGGDPSEDTGGREE